MLNVEFHEKIAVPRLSTEEGGVEHITLALYYKR